MNFYHFIELFNNKTKITVDYHTRYFDKHWKKLKRILSNKIPNSSGILELNADYKTLMILSLTNLLVFMFVIFE